MLNSRLILDALLIERLQAAYGRYRKALEERRMFGLSVGVPLPDGTLMRAQASELLAGEMQYLREYTRLLAMQTALTLRDEMPADLEIVDEYRKRLAETR